MPKLTKSPSLPQAIRADGLPIPLSRKHLKLTASWIRDDLDPIIAREGPEILHPDDVLTLHELFVRLADPENEIDANMLRYTRIHRAALEVAGKATRWPGRLADECDDLLEAWRMRFGHIELLRPYLFGTGGRLSGICGTGDLTRSGLIKLWELSCPDRLKPSVSHKQGCLGFTPGDWWINGLFACHAGIIDLPNTDGGIVHSKDGAYAVVLKDSDESDSLSPDIFTYRVHPGDRGRFRLCSADFKSRFPVRVLRSHSLSSLWSPRVGLRYEGLYRTTGWSVKPCKPTPENLNETTVWEVHFKRESEKVPMEHVLRHPFADEIEDSMEYKRLRRKRRDRGAAHPEPMIKHQLQNQPAASLSGENLTRRAPRKPISVIAREDPSRMVDADGTTPGTVALPDRARSFGATSQKTAKTAGAAAEGGGEPAAAKPGVYQSGSGLPSMRFFAPTPPPGHITLSPIRSVSAVVDPTPRSTTTRGTQDSEQSVTASSQSTLFAGGDGGSQVPAGQQGRKSRVEVRSEMFSPKKSLALGLVMGKRKKSGGVGEIEREREERKKEGGLLARLLDGVGCGLDGAGHGDGEDENGGKGTKEEKKAEEKEVGGLDGVYEDYRWTLVEESCDEEVLDSIEEVMESVEGRIALRRM